MGRPGRGIERARGVYRAGRGDGQLLIALAAALAGVLLAPGCSSATTRPVEIDRLDFRTIQQRILGPHSCLECHFEGNPDDLDPLTSYAAVLELVVPGDPHASELYTSVHSGKMPKKRPRMRASDERLLEAWIAAGAPREAPAAPGAPSVPGGRTGC